MDPISMQSFIANYFSTVTLPHGFSYDYPCDTKYPLFNDKFNHQKLPYFIFHRFIQLLELRSLRRLSFTSKKMYLKCLLTRGIDIGDFEIKKCPQHLKITDFKSGQLSITTDNENVTIPKRIIPFLKIKKLFKDDICNDFIIPKTYDTIVCSNIVTVEDVDDLFIKWFHDNVININIIIGDPDKVKDGENYGYIDIFNSIKKCFDYISKSKNILRIYLELEWCMNLLEFKHLKSYLEETELIKKCILNGKEIYLTICCYITETEEDEYEISVVITFYKNKFWLLVVDKKDDNEYYTDDFSILYSGQYFTLAESENVNL